MSRNTTSKWSLAQASAAAVDSRLHALSTGGAWQPPVVEADPDPDSGVQLWMFADGRLRARRPDTGAVIEYATTTPGAPTGPPLPPDWTTYPVTKQATVTAAWVASYGPNGPYEPAGFYDAAAGVAVAVGWDRAALDAIVGGAEEVTEVRVTLHHAAASADPVEIRYAMHTAAAQPPSLPGPVAGWPTVVAPELGPLVLHLEPMGWAAGPAPMCGVIVEAPEQSGYSGRIALPDEGPLYAPTLDITYRIVDPGALEGE